MHMSARQVAPPTAVASSAERLAAATPATVHRQQARAAAGLAALCALGQASAGLAEAQAALPAPLHVSPRPAGTPDGAEAVAAGRTLYLRAAVKADLLRIKSWLQQGMKAVRAP